MRKEDFEYLALFITIAAGIGGFVLYWVGKAINLNGKMKEHEMNRGFDSQRIEKLEERMDKFDDWYNRGRNN